MLQTFFHKSLIKGTGMPIKMKVCNVADYNEALKQAVARMKFLQNFIRGYK